MGVMNLVLKTCGIGPNQGGKDFSVVISCEDSTVARACEILQVLNKKLKNEEGRLLYQLWNIETLAFRELRELGALEAAQADLIIIGIRAGQELPGMVAAWMQRWLDLRQRRPGALMVVIEAGPKKPEAARASLAQLKEVAASGCLDFFTIGTKAGRDAMVVGGVSEAARQYVKARKNGVPNFLPGRWMVPAEASVRMPVGRAQAGL